jgi:hypothetical protein
MYRKVVVGDVEFTMSCTVMEKLGLDPNVIFIDRNPRWAPLIIKYAQGYHINLHAELQDVTTLEIEMLRDDLEFFGFTFSDDGACIVPMAEHDIGHILQSEYAHYLQAEDEDLYDAISNGKNVSACDVEKAKKIIQLAEFKESIMPYILKAVRTGLSLWQSNAVDSVDVTNLRETISERIENDEPLLKQLHDFSEIIKKVPFTSFVVDGVRMFIVNYFIYAK